MNVCFVPKADVGDKNLSEPLKWYVFDYCHFPNTRWIYSQLRINIKKLSGSLIMGVLPSVKVFNAKELESSIINAGFEIDFRWLLGKGKAVFIVAKKGFR